MSILPVKEARYYSLIPPEFAEAGVSFYKSKKSAIYNPVLEANLNSMKRTLEMANEEINVSERRHQTGRVNAEQVVPTPPSRRLVWDATDINNRRLLLDSSAGECLQTPQDAEAIKVFGNLEKVDGFFRSKFFRYPLTSDDHSMQVDVHNQSFVDNAFWSPSDRKVIYGQTSQFYNPMAFSKAILGHEFGHCVVDSLANFTYYGQGASLHESCADVFAIMLLHSRKNLDAGHSDTPWLIGEGLRNNTTGVGTALRCMDKPGTAYTNFTYGNQVFSDNQPDHMNNYVPQTSDHGGAHINSGIPSKAFYLTASKIGGGSWETAGKIWYGALELARPQDDFANFAQHTFNYAQQNYSDGVVNLVGQAWSQVGINIGREVVRAPERRERLIANPAQINRDNNKGWIVAGGVAAFATVLGLGVTYLNYQTKANASEENH